MKETKKAKLLSDEDVRRWYDNLYEGSPNTADVALRRLSRFCELASINHRQLLQLQQKQLEDKVQDAIRKVEKDGRAPDYCVAAYSKL